MIEDGRYIFDVYHSYLALTMVIIGVVVPILFSIFNFVLLRRRLVADENASKEMKEMIREMRVEYARETIERHGRNRAKF